MAEKGERLPGYRDAINIFERHQSYGKVGFSGRFLHRMGLKNLGFKPPDKEDVRWAANFLANYHLDEAKGEEGARVRRGVGSFVRKWANGELRGRWGTHMKRTGEMRRAPRRPR
jgi:hypothetical protein